jgi:hypothetical protein
MSEGSVKLQVVPGKDRLRNSSTSQTECLFLALSGHQTTSRQCLLLGVKRTWCGLAAMSIVVQG